MRALRRAVFALVLAAAVTSCSVFGRDEITTVRPESVELSLVTENGGLGIEISTLLGSCAKEIRPLAASFKSRGEDGTVTVGSLVVSRPPPKERNCLDALGRFWTHVELPADWREGVHDLTVVVAGRENRLRLVSAPEPALEVISAVNVTVVPWKGPCARAYLICP